MRASIATRYLFPARLEYAPDYDPIVTRIFENAMRREVETVHYTFLASEDDHTLQSLQAAGYIIEEWPRGKVPE